MGLRQRGLRVATGMPLVPIIVIAGLIFPVGAEVALDGSLSFREFEDRTDYCDDERETSCGIMFACKGEGEDDDCLLPVTEEIIPICLFGCWPSALLPVLSDDVHRVT